MQKSEGPTSLDEIKSQILNLSAGDVLDLLEMIEKRAETISMMKIAETGFREWNEAAEDIYDAEA
jgi:hypothetical protein